MEYSIGEFSKRTGLGIHTLRYYEQEQLITPKRNAANRRRYAEQDIPWVEFILLAQEGQVNLRVSNPWNGVASPARFWEEGWSTKGINRGLGLSSYVRILARYANVSRCTSWTNGVFLQELTAGGAS